MKAAVYREYGPPDVVRVAEVAKPIPARNEVLIQVRATTVSTGDWRMRSSEIPSPLFWLPARFVFGLLKPRRPILGTELSGVIAEVGTAVRGFREGDRVLAGTGVRLGGHAEYVALPEDAPIVRIPDKLGFEEAAALSFGGSTALCFLRDLGKIGLGQRLLVYGASGSVGTAAVQLGRYFGARVTAVCGSDNVGLVRSLGAEQVIDYKKEDFTACGEQFDLILDTVGKTDFRACKPLLKARGKFLPVVLRGTEVLQILGTLFAKRRVVSGVSHENVADLSLLAELAATGFLKVVIDRVLPLEQIVDAHRLVDSGRKRGNVVVSVCG